MWVVSSCLVYCFADHTFLATTLQDVRLQLVQEEANEVARGIPSAHKTSLSGFLTLGLELEEQQ